MTDAVVPLPKGQRRLTTVVVDAVPDDVYPEHEKLARVKDESQAIAEFLEWLGEQGIVLARYGQSYDVAIRDYSRRGRDVAPEDAPIVGWEKRTNPHALSPTGQSIERTLADYFGIDLDKIEAEKRAMLARQARS